MAIHTTTNWQGLFFGAGGSNRLNTVDVDPLDLSPSDAATLHTLWTYVPSGGGYVGNAPIVVANGAKLIVGGDDAKLRVLDANTANPAGSQLQSSTLGGAIKTTAYSDLTNVYVGADDSKLYARTVADITATAAGWAGPYTSTGQVHTSPNVSGGKVLFGNDAGVYYQVNVADGTLDWSYSGGAVLTGAFTGGVAVYGGHAFVANENGYLYEFDVAGKTLVRTYFMGGPVATPSIAAWGGIPLLMVGSEDHALNAFLIQTTVVGNRTYAAGDRVWEDIESGDVFSAPAQDPSSGYAVRGTHNWSFQVFFGTSGFMRWKQDGGSGSGCKGAAFTAHPGITNGLAYNTYAGPDGRIKVFQLSDTPGGHSALFKDPSDCGTSTFQDGSPIVVNNTLYVVDNVGTIHAYKR